MSLEKLVEELDPISSSVISRSQRVLVFEFVIATSVEESLDAFDLFSIERLRNRGLLVIECML